ncbi:hypothetical protein Agabi119p4_8791 [Agaricus bisporus var. burnettii]|uniref:Uncharacterized protein n=1 Tax=Agaricus bisporus var. burnettii TaxID=192524 RepID=A0A8H7C534_AGABI|nr:hypothetical protein Agabi119p4_8791 [Agaricus bisporus var. burnettii]
MILVSSSVIVLPSSRFPPVRLRKFEGSVDFVVQDTVPFTCLAVKANSEDTGLYSKLNCTARNVPQFWPW